MILTEKETNAIEDLKTQEQACIEKYTKYSNQAKDPVLKELFEEIARDEQKHFDSLDQVIKGKVPSMSKTICLYFMLPPFPVCIKITYHPAWISYCNTIRRDRAGNYASSPYHAVFPYSAQQLPKNGSAFFCISIIRKIIFPC